MLTRLTPLLVPRSQTAEEREYLTRHLTVTLRLTAAGLLVGGLLSWALGYEAHWGVLAASAALLVALRLAGAGRVHLASAVLLAAMLALATWLLWVGSGLQDVALLIYPVLVLVAGLLFERRPLVLLVALALASLLLVGWGQATGRVRLLAPAGRAEIAPDLLLAAMMIVVAAVMVHVLAEDLRRSLRQARRSEERYRLISEVTSDYTFSSVVDAAGQVRQDWVAGAFVEMTGYTFEQYVAHGGWRAALHPDDTAVDDAAVARLLANQPAVLDVRTFRRDGQLRWVRVYARPVWDAAAGRVCGVYGAGQDISERKRAEAEREALIRELSAKNAELERFTYTVSHDLKSPLVTVRGFLGFLERDALAGNHERLRADLDRIREATDRMGQLLDELLELSRVGRVVNPPAPVAWGQVVREAAALVQGAIAAGGVALEVADDLPVVWGDRVRLLQVAQNLIDNAVKFQAGCPEPRIEIGCRREAGREVLFVRDRGIGIEARHRERVFGLFEKLDAGSSGTGVGLALVRRIVDLHRGQVWVESGEAGTGTTFCLVLPGPPAVEPT